MSDPATAKSPVSIGDIVAGKYRVERVLGSGGMGVVVAATHLELDQLVALKFILPQALSGQGNVERFMREARAAVRLKSEHVARVYDVGRDGEDRPFMVLELLEGMDLAKLSKQKGSLPVADAVEYLLQACEALVEAHAAGIVHRDLKPQNLFVTRRLNGTPLVKVLDFGIAKAIGPLAAGQMSLTDSAAIIGSPLYMAPEQMRSARTAEVRSDIWALGVILFELLGGQLPFDGETVTEVCIRVVNERPADLLTLRPALDPELVAIVMRCLAKDPEQRFHNVSALASALEPFSRSAKQGGPVRPWRSFEDTQDSQNGSPFANVADATGPATLVSVDVVLPPEVLERSAAHERSSSSSGAPLVSTSSSWADSTSGQAQRDAKRPRSFSTGVVAAIVVAAAAAAAAGGLFLGRGSTSTPTPTPGAAAGPSTAASSIAATNAPAEPPAIAATAAVVTASPATAAPAAPPQAPRTPAPSTSASVAARLLSAGKLPRQSAAVRPEAASAPSAAPRPPEVKPVSDPVSPNGAPILH
ncbi:MAG TPA: serine/threonine-protein kinase [Labilithrix sp.]|nr:serine/threonine-protein kinase [Labilithrix sp.]